MRPHVDSMAGLELGGTEVVEKNEWAHHLPPLGRQYSAHHETAEVALPRIDQL
jgi:hypothetical protein